MKNQMLLPNRFKTIGWVILIPSLIIGAIILFTHVDLELKGKSFAFIDGQIFTGTHYFTFIEANITNTLAGVFFITGALLVGFSKEKSEDEFIAGLRLSSLLWAVLVNYLLLLLAFAFVYGTPFLSVMIYNIFTVLIIFIVRFNYVLYRNTKAAADEK